MLCIVATSPALNWIKSRCSLELQYGNLTLFRLAEVKDSYFSDPTVTHVSIFKGNAFRKRPNQGLCGILLEVMDIYPVIKHAELKFSERLASSNKKGIKQQRHYDEVSEDHFNPSFASPAIVLNNNVGTTTVEVHNTQNGGNDKPSDNSKPSDNEKPDKRSDNVTPTDEAPSYLYPKQRLKNHKYDTIDKTAVKGSKDHAIYEVLDLAAFKSHRPSMTTSFDSQVVDALAIDKQLRHPSANSLSSTYTFRQHSTTPSSQTGTVLNNIRVPLRSSFSTDASSSPNFRFQRGRSTGQSGSQTTGSSFKSNDKFTASYRSQRSLSTFASRSR